MRKSQWIAVLGAFICQNTLAIKHKLAWLEIGSGILNKAPMEQLPEAAPETEQLLGFQVRDQWLLAVLEQEASGAGCHEFFRARNLVNQSVCCSESSLSLALFNSSCPFVSVLPYPSQWEVWSSLPLSCQKTGPFLPWAPTVKHHTRVISIRTSRPEQSSGRS